MKKTISINISGIIFNIEEDAFDRLKNYLSTIKGYFDNSEGQDEIIDDIEMRIAELFDERTGPTKQVITDRDVHEIITIMGEPEDYLDEEEQQHQQSHQQQHKSNSSHFNNPDKKLFRDKEEGIAGGVCAGLAAYFQIDAVWIRLIWAISFFVFGTGFLAYIVMMVIVPEAKTTSDKLRMQGEPVDVDSIKKKVNEGFEKIKTEANNFGNKTKRGSISNFISSVADLITTLVKSIVKIFGSVIGVVFLIVGIGLLVAMFGAFFDTSGVFIHTSMPNIAVNEVFNGIFDSSLHGTMFVVGLVLFIGIPVLTIVIVGLRMIFKFQWPYKGIGASLLTAWIIGIFVTVFASVNLGKEFAVEDSVSSTIELNMPSDTIQLKLSGELEGNNYIHYNRGRVDAQFENFSIKDGFVSISNIGLDIEKVKANKKMKLEIIKSSHGRGYDDAETKVQNIELDYEIIGNALVIDPNYRFPLEDKIRGQEVTFVLYVPVGTYLYLDENVQHILDRIDRVTDKSKRSLMDKYLYMSEDGLIEADSWNPPVKTNIQVEI